MQIASLELLQTMLRITTEIKRGKLTLYIEGRLTGPWVGALEQCWRDLSDRGERQKFYINLCGVSFIDDAGKVLLKEMHRQGGELIAEGCLNQAIVNEIVSKKAKKDSGNEKDPANKKGSPIIFYIALLSLTLGAVGARAQSPNAAPPAPARRCSTWAPYRAQTCTRRSTGRSPPSPTSSSTAANGSKAKRRRAWPSATSGWHA